MDEPIMNHLYPGVRKEVVQFSKRMEIKLVENEWKGGWRGKSPIERLRLLRLEVEELEDALNCGTPEDVINEAADVGNFAMMIADIMMQLTKGSENGDHTVERAEEAGIPG